MKAKPALPEPAPVAVGVGVIAEGVRTSSTFIVSQSLSLLDVLDVLDDDFHF